MTGVSDERPTGGVHPGRRAAGALALHDLQAWLEQRDYDRHAED
jgi:hypothetical protein